MVGRGHPGGDGDGRRIALGGGAVQATRRLPTTDRARALSADPGVSVPDVYELDAPTAAPAFREAMEELKRGNRFHASVYVYDVDEYRSKRLFVTDDGKAGFALAGDEIVSVFRHPDGSYPNAGPALMAAAVDEGGRRLDCFDTVLPATYARAGFVAVARLRWNDEYAPDGWDYDTYARWGGGRPDVVFMAYDPEAVDGIYERGAGQYVDDYDKAAPLVDDFLRRRQ